MKRLLTHLALVLLLTVVVVVPVVGALFVLDAARAQIDPSVEAVWAPATLADAHVTEPAGVVVLWEEAQIAPASQWGDSVVQRVLIKEGETVKTGTEVAVLERITRVAAHTAFPLDRPLKFGDRGSDVKELNFLLDKLGFRSSEGSQFTRITEAGVREFAKSIGAGDQREFDPLWLIYVPVKSGVVSDVHLEVGQPVVSVGSPVFTYVAAPKAAAAYSENEFENFRAQYADEGDDKTPDGLSESSLPAGLHLLIFDEEFTTPGPDGFADDDLARIAELIKPGQIDAPALLQQELPDGAVQIPAAGVYTSASGATCLIARDEPSASSTPLNVDVVESSYGIAIVTGVHEGHEVWLNPPVEDRLECR